MPTVTGLKHERMGPSFRFGTLHSAPHRSVPGRVEQTLSGISGKLVLITGASRGLGRALAHAFAEEGARLAITARSSGGLASVAEQLKLVGAEVEAGVVDATEAEGVARFVERVEKRWGPLDALVNNASILGTRQPLRDCAPAAWREVLEINLTGAYLACRAALPAMRAARRGSIINVSSGVGDQARAGWGAYAISKRALEAFSSNLALEEREAGIRVNIVDPGAMRTDMRAAAYPDEDPGTLSRPCKAAGVFLWLASEAAADITGQRFRAQDWTGSAR